MSIHLHIDRLVVDLGSESRIDAARFETQLRDALARHMATHLSSPSLVAWAGEPRASVIELPMPTDSDPLGYRAGQALAVGLIGSSSLPTDLKGGSS